MKNTSLWPAFCMLVLITGCAPVPPQAPPPSPPPVIVVRADNEILAYALRYGAMTADEQRKEHALVMQAYNSNKTNLTNRMKAALVFSLPGSRQRDNTKALALLDDIQRDSSADPDTKAISALLKEYVNERIKLEENAVKLGTKLTDDQKRIESLQLKADGLQQKVDTLQQKLDELKNIEKTLNTRTR